MMAAARHHHRPRTHPGRRLLLTLLLALALHLAGAAVVYLLWPAAPTRTRPSAAAPTSIREVELVQLPPPPVRSRPPPVQVAPRAHTPRARPPLASSRRARPRRPLRPRPRARSARPTATRPSGPVLSLRMRPLDLAPSADLLDGERQVAVASRSTARGKEPQSEAARVKARIDRWLLRDAGERNVELGRAHPAIFTLLRRVERRFAPTEAMIRDRRHAGRELLNAYAAGIETFNKLGQALPLDRWEIGERSQQAVIPEGTVNLAFDRIVQEGARKKGSSRLTAEICFAAAPGKHPRVISVRGFGVAPLDRHARQVVQRAFAVAAMPADLPPTRGCYRLQIRFGRRLPTVTSLLTCSFDAYFTNWDCGWGVKKHLNHKVRLVAVWPER